jgi:hypothetical protein
MFSSLPRHGNMDGQDGQDEERGKAEVLRVRLERSVLD